MTNNIVVNKTSAATSNTILEVHDLKVRFKVNVKEGFFSTKKKLYAVNGVSFSLNASETLGIVGESGCGKSTLVRAILRIIPEEDAIKGKVIWLGNNIMDFSKKQLKSIRKDIEIVFQDPLVSLNPRMNILEIISEPLIVHSSRISKQEIIEKVTEVMKMVGLNPKLMYRYPHEFSGGQSQRICIARAIILKPKLIVCDEAVSALDVSVKAQIINLLQQLKQELKVAFLFISHDLGIVEYISDRVMVLYLGEVMELAKAEDICNNPMHPYTKALIASIPVPNPEIEIAKKRIEMPGDIPSPFELQKGCPFASRCNLVFNKCYVEKPKLLKIKNNLVACHKVAEEYA